MNINSNIVNINNCLDITGNSGTITNVGGAYITSTIGGAFESGYSSTPIVFSLRTADNIICGKNSYALSDKRIKKDIYDINDNDALLKIMKIEPKTYNYIDTIQRTSSNVYGFIAQQIREVIPEAVEIISKFVPNIYKLVSINKNKFFLDDYGELKINDILQIYTLNSIEEVKILQINPILNSNLNSNEILLNSNEILLNSNEILLNSNLNSNLNINEILLNSNLNYNLNSNEILLNSIKYEIIIDKDIEDVEIFVYGSYVKDFHILDKSYLYTLNICATQQIYKDICLLTSNLEYKTNVIR